MPASGTQLVARLAMALAITSAIYLASACSDAEEAAPLASEGVGAPNARTEVVAQMAADLAAERHPADGAGRAWLDDHSPERLRASELAQLVFVFEAGPLGIARHGSVYFQTPLWSWTNPAAVAPDGRLVTSLVPTDPALGIRVLAPEPGIVQFLVTGRAMRPGEKLEIHYGDERRPVRVGLRAERRARFPFWVDGDGDGIRGLVPDPPSVDIVAGPATRLVAHLPATLRPGEPALLRIAALDAFGSSGTEIEGEFVLELPDSVEGPKRIPLDKDARGVAAVRVTPTEEGILELIVHGPNGLEARTPPSLVSAEAERILWLDLHGHTQLSDGTGTPDDYFAYARDVAALDGAAITDHDHWGVPYLDGAPENWNEIRAAVTTYHDPGSFVALLGYEWTHWIWGHRHVVHFATDGPLHSWVDPATDTPARLWDSLRGLPALTFAHHSAGDPVATDWTIPPDPELEPITEIASVHGSSESRDTPTPVRGGFDGNFVRDALDRGYRLGFVGSGDSHDGHPGLVHLTSPSGGLAAVFAPERTREAILAALRARRSYATNGPRILLDVRLDGNPMGSLLARGGGTLEVQAAAPGDLAAVELVADGAVVEHVPVEGRSASLSWTLPPETPERWLYVRVLQEDGGAAWSSPFFVAD